MSIKGDKAKKFALELCDLMKTQIEREGMTTPESEFETTKYMWRIPAYCTKTGVKVQIIMEASFEH